MKFRLLLLDANIVIYLHELGIWSHFIEKCSVTLTQTVIDEAQYYEDEERIRYPIDLKPDIESKKIQCIDVPIKTVEKLVRKYGPVYLEKLDDGEAESLAFLMDSQEKWLISSSDRIVFKTLGREGRSEQGISLEEILTNIGLTQSDLKYQYTKIFREKNTHEGQIDSIQGFGHAD